MEYLGVLKQLSDNYLGICPSYDKQQRTTPDSYCSSFLQGSTICMVRHIYAGYCKANSAHTQNALVHAQSKTLIFFKSKLYFIYTQK